MMDRIIILSRLLDVAQRLAVALGAVLIVALGVLMNTEIVSRYVFGVSTQIADEYAGYFFTAATLLCFLPALREGRFLKVEGAVRLLPRRAQAVLECAAALVGAGVATVLASATFDLAATSFAYGTVSLQAYATPLVIPQAVMPIGFALLALAFLEQGLLRARRLWRGQPAQPVENPHAVD